MTIEIDHLRDRARSFRRRAEWMLDGADRERLIARASEYDTRAVSLSPSTVVNRREPLRQGR